MSSSVIFSPSQLRSTDSSTTRRLCGSRETGPTPFFSSCGSEKNCPTGPESELKVCKESNGIAGIAVLKLFPEKSVFAGVVVQVEV
jgi:hypothetical protein